MRYSLQILHQCDKRVKTKFLGANSYVCRTFLPPIMNSVKHDKCIVQLSLISTSLIILTTLKNFTTRESFWCNYVCLWRNCLYALPTNTSLFCSMFRINDTWLFVMNYVPQTCRRLSKARHNDYVVVFQKLSKGWNWNCPSL